MGGKQKIISILGPNLVAFFFRVAVESLWVDWRKLDSLAIIVGERKRRIIFGTLWFITSLLIGIFVPSIQSVIGILGSLAAAFIFIFPGKRIEIASLGKLGLQISCSVS